MSFRGDRGRGGGRGGFGQRGGPPDGGRGRGGFHDRSGSTGGRGFDRGGGGRGRGFSPREAGGVFAPNQPAVVDGRLTDNSQEALLASFRSLAIRDNDLPLRPDFGKFGTPVKLRTNFFPVKVPKGPLFEYDVAISPASGTAIRRVKRRIFQLAENTPGWTQYGLKGIVAHDHSSKLIAAKKLPQPLAITVPFYEENDENPKDSKKEKKEYTLTITYIQDLETQSLCNHLAGNPKYRDYDILPVIAALNVTLAAHPSRTGPGGGVMVGRNRFFFPSPSSPPVPLGGGLEAWKGFYSSVRVTFKQLMVNVNVCTTAFYTPGNLAEAMMSFRNASFGARDTAFVKGVRIQAIHLGYKKTVKAVSRLRPREYEFDCAEFGGSITVEQYFKRKYKITLRHPELPLVDVGGQKTNYLPAEVCEILPGQPFRGKLTDDHTANMITVACKPPNINAGTIVGLGLDELGFRQGAGPLQAFGISIGTEMAVVPGRILPPPGIKYKQGTPRVDERASWNLKDVTFAIGGRLENWAVMLIQDGNREEFRGVDDPELRTTIQGFVSMCRKSGMEVAPGEPPYITARLPPKNPANDPTRQAVVNEIERALKSTRRPTMVLVILSNGDKHVYAGIKQLCDSKLGVATVCVHAAKIRKERGQMQYFANVALKLNMKLGGVNHALDAKSMTWLKAKPTMLVGMDVTHPGPGSIKGTPSIAAVVASVDHLYAQYPASMEIQETKKEMITNLASMMHERLDLFRMRNNKKLPERILVYRDGVSEGQLLTVVREELPAMRVAFKKFDTATQPYRPKLTIVVCGKRHHTRFFPTDANNADRDGNPRPGTVVDRGVTAIYDFDFFLQAHGSLQGTTRPTHYYVVHDEIGFKADELQGLTNSVSYMFARATKAVSLVSPAYYADLACERGRCYLHRMFHGISSAGGTSSSAEDAVMKEAAQMWGGGVAPPLRSSMFYI